MRASISPWVVRALGVVWLAVAAGCGVAGPGEPETDGTNALDPPLEVTAVEPDAEKLAPDATLQIRFRQYLDPDAFRTFDTGNLVAGKRDWPGWTDYRMTDKTLVWRPRSSLPTGIDVRLQLGNHLQTTTGASIEERTDLASWRIEQGTASSSPPDPPSSWDAVASIFAEHCGDCHSESNRLPELTPDGLVGEPSMEVDRVLVRPYSPADSYLMHKLLWDFPERRFSPQPPPWNGGEELSDADQRTVEAWIDAGAPGG